MANRFLLTEYAHSWIDASLYIASTTDVPCHIFLRWTDVEERIHLRSKTDRGLAKLGDPKYCFVQYNEVEQNEAGDTLSHTFNFAGWTPCIRRWWMFRATIGGQDSPSNTCIFSAHCPDQEKADSLKHTDLVEKEVAGVIDHADESIPSTKLLPDRFGWDNAQTILYAAHHVPPGTTWGIINVSAQTSPRAKYAYVQLQIIPDESWGTGHAYLQLRPRGQTPTRFVMIAANIKNGHLAGAEIIQGVWILLDENQEFEFRCLCYAGMGSLFAIVLHGWLE